MEGVTTRPWIVRVGHVDRKCQAEVVRGGTRGECFRSGMYGWEDQLFCYQHHPDLDAWHEEQERLTSIARIAIERAFR